LPPLPQQTPLSSIRKVQAAQRKSESLLRYVVVSLLRLRYFAPTAAATPAEAVWFTTGAPIRLPHSVHDPS